ncbi:MULTISPECIES: hypothetical protein [Moorena]|uniref:Uncharacterized protein n=1 Tax=Moorena producens 3L TaxID=489825 RepID=F4XKH5_9CYAN|nr:MULTISPECIES: hypothetical protein [Moorena]EGJ34830.1 hypothetical protein LYNGBM3L_11750 [Moorena producens 3L]OLT63626.1 hypothetical protein BI334_00075 [Moorena producens 3L]
MNISDLNHIEVVNEETNIVGGSDLYRSVTFYDVKDIYITEYIDIDKYVDSYVSLRGNLATAEATASADGYNSLSETFSDAKATNYSSDSISLSVAAVGY